MEGVVQNKGAFALSVLLPKSHSILELRYLANLVGNQVEVSEIGLRAGTAECGWVVWCVQAETDPGQRSPLRSGCVHFSCMNNWSPT